MFEKILIANRGEIACRVMKTARRLGIKTVAVHSDADRDALHAMWADEAIAIGPPPARESYLVTDKLLAVCRANGVQAVHPGYGFLSENAGFAEALANAGIVFIGPPAEAIRKMGDKIASKKLAAEAGVPVIPGFTDTIRDPDHAAEIAAAIGYPVMVKAAAGGGGKGLRVAWKEAECREGFESCRREAAASFADDRVFIEKFIEEPRHIEVQILADAHGNAVYLWERECSIQRRHQKVIEEAPSPFLDEATRRNMGERAVALALASGYQSAGTVEFVVDRDRNFYFLEMNTRLQVEHPVTECITGLDLVEWMLRIAAGEPLAFRQEDIALNGWAMEARVCAEDPFRNFLPSVGRLVRYLPPEEQAGAIRVDTGVYEGGEVSIYYDSLIAKVITHGITRDQAISRMRDALNSFCIKGLSHNISFLAALLQNPRFVSGRFTTAFIAEEYPKGFHAADVPHDDPAMLIAVAASIHRRYLERASRVSGQLPGHERRVEEDFVVFMDDEEHPVTVSSLKGGHMVVYRGEQFEIMSRWKFGQLLYKARVNHNDVCMQVERVGLHYRLHHWGAQRDVLVMTVRAARLQNLMPKKAPPDLSCFLLAPMPGLLSEVSVNPGQEVKAGEKLAIIEAMKMENILKADRDAMVEEVLAQPGESLSVDQPILRFC